MGKKKRWNSFRLVRKIFEENNLIFWYAECDQVMSSFRMSIDVYHFRARIIMHSRGKAAQIGAYVEGRIRYNPSDGAWNTFRLVSINPVLPKTRLKRKHYADADEVLIEISRLPTDRWYRGHAHADWKLQTAIARQQEPNFELEEELYLNFKREATFLDLKPPPTDLKAWTFLMQHHGVPTRLLDWTASPLVALYFALCDPKKDDTDACIWVLNPNTLNWLRDLSYPYESEEDDDTQRGEEYLAIHAPYTNLRMKMQQSRFTLHTGYSAMEDHKQFKSFVEHKLIIDQNIKSELRARLENLGIERSFLFADLDSIAQMVKSKIPSMVKAGIG